MPAMFVVPLVGWLEAPDDPDIDMPIPDALNAFVDWPEDKEEDTPSADSTAPLVGPGAAVAASGTEATATGTTISPARAATAHPGRRVKKRIAGGVEPASAGTVGR
ncbi:MAG TPA: hypothetical protein VFC03_05415, partial [Acidimicrobiales bacterium]|nr:hypothetical protein [Acidimicrobiales bacterium]